MKIDKNQLRKAIPIDQYCRDQLGEPQSTLSGKLKFFCPFHEDHKTPNLIVDEKGFKCFACNAGGDIFEFHGKLKGLPFTDVLEELAEQYAPHLLSNNGNGHQNLPKKEVAHYDYRNEDGELLFQVVRYEPKDFRQRVPDGNGGWEWGLNGTKPILFKLPELLASKNTIYIVEGEKDVEHLMGEGLTVTCNPMGAGKWKPEYDEYFKERDVVIFPDNDEPSHRHSKKVADSLKGFAKTIKVVDLSDLEEKQDVSDYLNIHSLAELLKRVDDTPTYVAEKKNPPDSEEDDDTKLTQSQILIELASGCEFFHCPDGEVYVTFPNKGHKETWRIRSKGFQRWLVGRFYAHKGKPPHAQAFSDAIGVFEAKAQYEGQQHSVYIRIGGHAGKIYLDLCNDQWEAVEVASSGWETVSKCPIKFIRTKGMLPLPSPESGGSLITLRSFMNLQDETSWKLVIAYMVASLRDWGPYPILVVQGEQGSAKSTLGRIIRSLIDPSSAPLRTKPREERDLMIAARNGWVLGFDNLSGIPNWLSDALCRLSTGGGFSTWKLYTDAEEEIFDAQRPCLVNGIDDLAVRDDFRDRAIIINLPTIPEEKRKDEKTFWQEFEQARPKILGALLHVVSAAIKNLPLVRLDTLPRMADFAKWIVSAEPALEWQEGSFLAAYCGNREAAVEIGIEASPIAQAIIALREPMESHWEGTATELLEALEKYVLDKISGTKAWPKNSQTLSNKLRRLAPSLRTVGYPIEFDIREGHSHKRKLRIKKDDEKIVRSVRNLCESDKPFKNHMFDENNHADDGGQSSQNIVLT